jgi:HAD superfamily hydrolase (TIGR01509 family)
MLSNSKETVMSDETKQQRNATQSGPAFIFDLDGTLVDSVYQHVLAWREALEKSGVELSVWRIHRRIGMSGGLLIDALLREIGCRFTKQEAENLAQLHEEAYGRLRPQVRVLPGTLDLLTCLSSSGVPYAIATSGRAASAQPVLALLQLEPEVPVITRDEVERAKPDPDLFLAAAKSLGVSITQTVVVGDSVWDLLGARRALALGVGLLSGGYGQDELERAGAYRVYQDPADLLLHLNEVGIRTAR